jgi:hypothetical protein
VVDKMGNRLALPDERAPPVTGSAFLLINAYAEGGGLNKSFDELGGN